jgi:hypothetical protein
MTPIAVAAPSQSTAGTSHTAVSATVAQRPDILVVVQREWNGWKKAMAPLAALESVHWHRPQGAPRPMIHAYVNCDAIVSGDVPHECVERTSHRLLVCVIKCHTAPSVFDQLVARANAAAAQTPAV